MKHRRGAIPFTGSESVESNALPFTAFQAAIEEGHTDVMKAFLDSGIAVDTADAQGWTPLHISAEAGDVKMVEYLLQCGADPKRVTASGELALHLAVRGNHVAIV